MIRAGYSLWQFPTLLETQSWYSVLLTGLRFDLALIGALLLVPVVIGSVLGMIGVTRLIAKSLLIIWFLFALGYVLLTELMTPYFMLEKGVRPDLAVLAELENPALLATNYVTANVVPAVIAAVLVLLIFVAYVRRLEIGRLLRYRLSVWSALALLILGGAACLLAIRSEYDPGKPALSPNNSLVSTETVINEITMNTGYKMGYSAIQPYFAE
jgi:hypothetical protein